MTGDWGSFPLLESMASAQPRVWYELTSCLLEGSAQKYLVDEGLRRVFAPLGDKLAEPL